MFLKNFDEDLNVVALVPELSDGIIPAWLVKLEECGLQCEFPDDFTPETFGGMLPIKVTIVPNAFPRAQDYGQTPVWGGVDWTIRKLKNPKSITTDSLQNVSNPVKWEINLEAVGVETISVRLELFMAATLAVVCKGVLIAQSIYEGEAAIRRAYELAAQYEDESHENGKFFVSLFQSWSPLGRDIEGDDIPY